MARVLRWGVMGNANIARVCLIPAIQKSNNGRVCALATRFPDQARDLAEEHDIRRVYDSYETLLADDEIDAVYLPLPNHLHHPWTIRALQAGKHVLCEKPLACSASEAREMAAAAADCQRLLMEAFMYRFHPRSHHIQRMVERGEIGDVRLIRSAFCFPMAQEVLQKAGTARLHPHMGGGALLDVGCYSVSVMRWLFGAEPERIQAQAVYHAGGADIHFVGSLRFPGDRLGVLEAGFISALQQTYSVVGTEGAIELPHNAFIPWESEAVFTVREKEQEVGQVHSVSGADQYQLMVEHFSAAAAGTVPLAYPPADSIENMRVLDALAMAARTGETVVLAPAEAPGSCE